MDTVPEDTDGEPGPVLRGLQKADLRMGQKVWLCSSMNHLILTEILISQQLEFSFTQQFIVT